MNKYSVTVFIIIIAIFGGISFATQAKTTIKPDNSRTPSPSPAANTIQLLPPYQSQQQVLGADQGQGQMQQQAPPPEIPPTYGVEEAMNASYSAVIKTSKGDIHVTLFGSDAPKTVRNFLDKAQNGYYKNLIFHRVENWVIQGGDPKGDGTGGGNILTEPNNRPFVTGSLGVARGGDPRVSNDSQFFITKSNASWLNQQYTNFGIVTDGMDVVNQTQIGDKILEITVEKSN